MSKFLPKLCAQSMIKHAAVFLSPISLKHPRCAAQCCPEDSSHPYRRETILACLSIHPSVCLFQSSSSSYLLSALFFCLPPLHPLSPRLPAVLIFFCPSRFSSSPHVFFFALPLTSFSSPNLVSHLISRPQKYKQK